MVLLANRYSYKQAVLEAVNLGQDTDTTAAVVGQVAGAYYGLEAIPRRLARKAGDARRDRIPGEWIYGSRTRRTKIERQSQLEMGLPGVLCADCLVWGHRPLLPDRGPPLAGGHISSGVTINYFSFFTIQSNWLVAVWWTFAIFAGRMPHSGGSSAPKSKAP